MKITTINLKTVKVTSDGIIISTVSDMLDLIGTVGYTYNSDTIIISKDSFKDSFFDLKTGELGEIFQKCINYGTRLFIYGDFNTLKSNSKAFNDFVYETNSGKSFYFAESESDAISHLEKE